MKFYHAINPALYWCRKFLRVMRLTAFFVLLFVIQVSAQGLAQKVTLNEKQVTLDKVFKDIRKQTGLDYFFYGDVVSKIGPVTIKVKNVTVEEALEQIIKAPLTFTIENKTITVKEKDASPPAKSNASLTSVDIIGRVTTTHNVPLYGASVTIKRTQTGQLTDANGNFTLRGVNSTDTLVVSYVGYGRQYFPVGNQTDLKIVLKETSNKLDEVVVQAYGETSQRLATGDIGTVSAKEIEKHPTMNVLDALQGQVPGVIVTNTGGYASGVVKVEIRGRNTVNPDFSTDPLYIVDGVPLTILTVQGGSLQTSTQSGFSGPAAIGQSPLFSLNPSDIESISVLKDADATAIYGSRGANGVILITTKKGKAGKVVTNVSVSEGVNEITQRYQFLNTQQYFAMREAALKNDNDPIDINNAPDLVVGSNTRYTNWENYFWGGTGRYTDAQIGISGGDAQTTFRVAGGYQASRDVTTVSGQNGRASLSLNLDHKSLNQRLDIALTANYSYSFTNQVGENQPNLPPNAPPVFNANGSANFAGWDAYYGTAGSWPFGGLLQPYLGTTNFLTSNLSIKYQIVKGFHLQAVLAITIR
jgi:TonB-dependent SusC/RagA subfamily outer membrane receptor